MPSNTLIQNSPPAIKRLVYTSLGLNIPILVFSLITLGQSSLWMVPACILVTSILHGIMVFRANLALSRLLLFFQYFLALAWLGGLAMTIFMHVVVFYGRESTIYPGESLAIDAWKVALASIETLLVIAQVVIMWTLAIVLTKERRRKIGFPVVDTELDNEAQKLNRT